MRVAHGRHAGGSEQRTATFTGSVWADPVLPSEDGVGVTTVFFAPGARTHWHSHEAGQLLLVTHGEGFVQARGEEPHPIRPGDVVHIASGEVHWHGAAGASYLVHIAISLGGHAWLEPVIDSDYARATGEG